MKKNTSWHFRGDTDHKTHVRRKFWVIKNGIKLTGMPAGVQVAFIDKLKGMSAEVYQKLTADGKT